MARSKYRWEQLDDTTWVEANFGWAIIPHEHEHWVWAVLAPGTENRVAYAKTITQAQCMAERLQELHPVE